MKLVTEAHVQPHGWLCEACDAPFSPGDIAYGTLLAVLDEETCIEGDWRCQACYDADLPIAEAGAAS